MIQLQVLNKILKSKDASFITENNLSEDYFSDYEEEFLFIKNHISSYGKVPDIETFLIKFKTFDIIDVSEDDSYLLSELIKDRNTRFLVNTFNSIRNALQNNQIDKALDIYKSSVENQVTDVGIKSVDIISDISRYDSYVERSRDFSKFYVKTGFAELDNIIGGWDRTEELATIVARTNSGKSFVLFKCAVAAAEQGLNVGIYEGEMSANKVGYRIDTLISHISNSGITHGNIELQNSYKKFLDNIKSTVKGPIRVLTPTMISGPAGVSSLRSFIEKDHLDILFVDQHSLLEDDRHAKNPVERASNISKDLKNLQVMKKIPIISVSQQNRTSTENGVSTEHIAQADRIGQDSTVVLFFEQKDGILTMSLVKSRDSQNGVKIKYAVDFDKGVFTYIPNEEIPQDAEKVEDIRSEFEDPNYGGEDAF